MKKILLSLGVIAVVGGVVWGATGAFYNDTETSTGNIFTAGSIDLKVDQKYQSYNGHNCEQFCEPANNTNLVLNGGFEVPEVTNSAQWEIFPSGATGLMWTVEWVGNTTTFNSQNRPTPALVEYHEGVLGAASEGDQYAELDSDWFGPSNSLDGEPASVRVWQDIPTVAGKKYRVTFDFAPRPNTDASENQLQFSWDGSQVAVVSGAGGGSIIWTPKSYDVTASGALTRIAFADVGTENSVGTFLDNVKVVELNCDYDLPGAQSCQLWEETNLSNQKFFNFNDIKPADFGTNVISLHVSSNDAYACLIVGNKDDKENTLLSPETADGDLPNVGNLNGFGELSNYINVFTWGDTDGDGLFDKPAGESAITLVPVSLGSVGNIASSTLSTTVTQNIGLAWCAGTLTVDNTSGAFSCDGDGMPNKAQSDSFTADLTAYAEQVRNNSTFNCGSVVLP